MLTTNTDLSSKIIARYTNFVSSISAEAQMLLLKNGWEEPSDTVGNTVNQTVNNIWQIHQAIVQTEILNLNLSLRFLGGQLASAVRTAAQVEDRAAAMTQRYYELKQENREIILNRDKTVLRLREQIAAQPSSSDKQADAPLPKRQTLPPSGKTLIRLLEQQVTTREVLPALLSYMPMFLPESRPQEPEAGDPARTTATEVQAPKQATAPVPANEPQKTITQPTTEPFHNTKPPVPIGTQPSLPEVPLIQAQMTHPEYPVAEREEGSFYPRRFQPDSVNQSLIPEEPMPAKVQAPQTEPQNQPISPANLIHPDAESGISEKSSEPSEEKQGRTGQTTRDKIAPAMPEQQPSLAKTTGKEPATRQAIPSTKRVPAEQPHTSAPMVHLSHEEPQPTEHTTTARSGNAQPREESSGGRGVYQPAQGLGPAEVSATVPDSLSPPSRTTLTHPEREQPEESAGRSLGTRGIYTPREPREPTDSPIGETAPAVHASIRPMSLTHGSILQDEDLAARDLPPIKTAPLMTAADAPQRIMRPMAVTRLLQGQKAPSRMTPVHAVNTLQAMQTHIPTGRGREEISVSAHAVNMQMSSSAGPAPPAPIGFSAASTQLLKRQEQPRQEGQKEPVHTDIETVYRTKKKTELTSQTTTTNVNTAINAPGKNTQAPEVQIERIAAAVMRQVNVKSLADQVYRDISERLRNERIKRGLR